MKIEKWAIDKVIPYPLNVKKHDKAQVQKIAQSIRTFGWTSPIIVDKHGEIIAGHGRRLAAIELGYTEVPVVVRHDLNPEQVRAARLADNRAAVGDLDMNMLREELATLEFNVELLDGIFDAKELEFSLADLGEMTTDAFIEDLDSAVEKQNADTATKVEELKQKRIPLSKALGFKDIAGADERAVSRFMAEIERQSGLKGEAAFLAFVNGLVGEAA